MTSDTDACARTEASPPGVSDPTPTLSGLVRLELLTFRDEVAFAPIEFGLRTGEAVVFQDAIGEDLGRVTGPSETEPDPDSSPPRISRRANATDIRESAANRVKADAALHLFRQLVNQYRLPMKPVDAHLRLDRREICFYFVSDERLNFRALHRAVSSALNLRVAIRQIGVRDFSRVLGGIGPCGRLLCCKSFLGDLKPVTLRMARQQSLFVEPSKISGLCGKLLCCLRFEETAYARSIDEMPQPGGMVLTGQGEARVKAVDPIRRCIVVELDGRELTLSLDDISAQ